MNPPHPIFFFWNVLYHRRAKPGLGQALSCCRAPRSLPCDATSGLLQLTQIFNLFLWSLFLEQEKKKNSVGGYLPQDVRRKQCQSWRMPVLTPGPDGRGLRLRACICTVVLFKTGQRPGNKWGVSNDSMSSCLRINCEISSGLLKFSERPLPFIS